jgi:DNA-binding response OmpR family regulator
MKQTNILLIEDDLSVANAISRIMKEESMQVEHIDNGKDGLAYIT